MNLVLVTALIAVCRADKLDRTYLPPVSATTAGGSSESLQTPFRTFNQGLGGLPKGGYSNDYEGVVVDAAAPGTRASGASETGLGGPRITYGSTDSKVGEAAFTDDVAFPRVGLNSGLNTGSAFGKRPERIQSSRDRISNIVKYENDVNPDSYNYAFETDNGIIAEENGIEVNGVKAQGGYSYTGDDGQVYSVTYTADKEGYKPKGDHLPTPPPIPVEILKSLEKNAQDEAAGVIDDGSYDAKKYNTGDDYTNADHGQFGGGQRIPIGNGPQSDAVASGSFISQNQGFIKPNSNQFDLIPSRDSSNGLLNENFGGSSGVRPAQNAQTFGFGSASKNEYLPPSSNFNQNRRPSINGVSGTQSDLQSGFPVSSPSNAYSNVNNKQNVQIPAFVPLAQQKLQEDRTKRPQSNSPIFGKPTVIDSTLSIKDPFAKRPSGNNRFSLNKQPNEKPQAVGGSFEVVSGNVYSSKNEYLPPRRQNNKPNQNNGNQHFQGTNYGTQPSQQFLGSQSLNPNSQSASAFVSLSRPTAGLQSSQQYNTQQMPQYAVNNLYNQMSQNTNNRPLNKDQPSLSSGFPNSYGFNRSPVSQLQYKPPVFATQYPTLKPLSELTTPFESNSDPNKKTAPLPIIDGPDSPSFISSSNLPSLGSQQSNSVLGQYSSNSNKIQQALPTQASASAVTTLSDLSLVTLGSQNAPDLGKPASHFGVQSQFSNRSPVNGQFTFSSQRPSFNQYNQQHGSDDSYYYNTPSKPFNTPTPRPQASVFPSSSFDQPSRVTQTFFDKSPQLSDVHETFLTPQSNTSADSSKYPKPSTVVSVPPTQPTKQGEGNLDTFQSQHNKVTQASLSSFSPAAPSADVDRNRLDQFNARPTQHVDRNKEIQGFNQQGLLTPTQQYDGTIYEYNKPPQTLPTPQNGATSGQFGHTTQFGLTSPTPQVPQSQPSGTYKPSSQFGSQFGQQPTLFGQRPQNYQVTQEKQPFNPTQAQLKPGQFLQPSVQGQNSQSIQGASKFPPTYNNEGPPCCKKADFGSQSSQADRQEGAPLFGNQLRPNQGKKESDQGPKPVQSVSTFPVVGENFGGPRKPPSFDETGYHY